MPNDYHPAKASAKELVRFRQLSLSPIASLLSRHGLEIGLVAPEGPIPGTYWGAPEAGLVGRTLFAREDTPIHSVLHEASHFICMSEERRQRLNQFSDAGGDDLEEAAVCYLQILLADEIPGCSRQQMCRDMDLWGYSFRLGSAREWFEKDAEDAREWLRDRGLLPIGASE